MKLNPSGLVKSEPVLVAHGVAWLLLQAGLILVGRYHVLSSNSWSSLSSALAPVVTAVAMGLLALFIRRVVSPVWNLIQRDAGPLTVDVQNAIAAAQATYPMPTASSGVTVTVTPPTAPSEPSAAPTPGTPTA